jgi:hypothetical protein
MRITLIVPLRCAQGPSKEQREPLAPGAASDSSEVPGGQTRWLPEYVSFRPHEESRRPSCERLGTKSPVPRAVPRGDMR